MRLIIVQESEEKGYSMGPIIFAIAFIPVVFIGAHLAVIVPEMWMMRYDPEHSIKRQCAELNQRYDEMDSLVKKALLENGTKSEEIERAEWRLMTAKDMIWLAPTEVAGGNKDGWDRAEELLDIAQRELILVPRTLTGDYSHSLAQPLPKRKGIETFGWF
jgi:hypothetical protein